MKITKYILLVIISIIAIVTIQLFISGYIQWYFNGMYEITSANIEQIMDEDGIVHVHEVINYKMRKPFRGVYRYVEQSRAVKIENVKLWIENVDGERVEFLRKNSREFEARVWVSNTPISPQEIENIELHVTYDAKYVFENGSDISQVFRQFWGPKWDAPVSNITVKFVFPEDLKVEKIYTHPKINYSRNGNTFTLNIKKLPPYTFAEARFIFPPKKLKYSYENPSLYLGEIEKIEKSYSTKVFLSRILPPILTILSITFLILIFNFFGREKEIQYSGIYEREIPYNDSPDIVNAIVVNQLSKIDSDGISAVIMDLYKKKYVELDKEGEYIKILDRDGNDLSETEKFFYQLLKKYSYENIFSFSQLKKTLSKDKKLAKDFLDEFNAYKSLVVDIAKSRKYLSLAGTYLSYLVGIFSIISSILIFFYFSKINFLYQSVFSSLIFAIGAGVFILPKDVFGSWSKEGREYYLKWKNFEKFLTEYSLLSQYPPESIILWEDYLVYATALSIADKVEKHLKKLIPKDIDVNETVYYYPYRRFGRQFYVVSTVAHSTVYGNSSGKGGFSGGAGGIGGGSGGGGGGAF